MTAKKIATCLWFDGRAEEAAHFYAATFPDSHVSEAHRSPIDYPNGKAGDVITIEFSVLGQNFVGLNGGPMFKFDEAISFQIYTDDQAETDRLWDAITKDGGAESQCGWCKDKFGLSWQIVPRRLMEMMSSKDTEAGARGMGAMMQMQKIDIAKLEAAYVGEPVA
ncbi:MAG: 3-demethylubiquinone-9 3-methyltransferase [Sphingomonas bacterium]|uniref:VOC family protein n=1 Tax=Sphingomonas bacterium TaxID=1895847 RepID=UPI0026091070|nr:VOC family protein [Sphingomonas bacterium]MDB5712360.1 3-demethylubiquinone-9 3-methyltransferase [Sphingomonas bacterium]